MNSVVVYPTTEHQISLLEALFKEMKIRFSVKREKQKDDSLMTKAEYFAMLDERIKETEVGKGTIIRNKQELQSFLRQNNKQKK